MLPSRLFKSISGLAARLTKRCSSSSCDLGFDVFRVNQKNKDKPVKVEMDHHALLRVKLRTIKANFVSMAQNFERDTQQKIQHRRRRFGESRRQMAARFLQMITKQYPIIFNSLSLLGARPLRHRMANKTRSSDWWDRIVQDNYLEEDWVADFRMRRESFENLCVILNDSLLPSEYSLQEPLDVRKKVAITLYKLASCCEYRVVANQFGVHKSTVQQTFYAVIKAMNFILVPAMIAMPNEVEATEIAYLVKEKYKFPQAFLAIDGSHIPVLPPKDGYRDFTNRKGWASIVLQGIVDNKFRFRDISCILPGSAHDARILSESYIFQHADEVIPKVPNNIDGVEVPLMVLGDAAYPLLNWLMKGYTGLLTPEQESFNVYLSSFRISVEIAFGRLKARWRCLCKRIDVHYTFVPKVVAACCALHNYVENGKEHFIDQWLDDVREAEIMFPQPPHLRPIERDDYNMANIRNHLCNYLAQTLPLRQSSFRLHNHAV